MLINTHFSKKGRKQELFFFSFPTKSQPKAAVTSAIQYVVKGYKVMSCKQLARMHKHFHVSELLVIKNSLALSHFQYSASPHIMQKYGQS